MIHFIHRIDPTNTGDLSCCPLLYFSDLKKYTYKKHDIYNINFKIIKKDDIVILGGGGLFDCLEEWNISINKLLKKCKTVIAWSVGFNTHSNTKIKTKINFSKFKLLTIRDFNHPFGFEFLPCPSCNIKSLKYKYQIKRKIGIVNHKAFDINLPYEKINNTEPLNNLIKFIGESSIIITTSYHVTYWATLMERGVVLLNPFSTKFNYLKYRPMISFDSSKLNIDEIVIHKGVLHESQNLNYIFYKKVKSLIEKKERKISNFKFYNHLIYQKLFLKFKICYYIIIYLKYKILSKITFGKKRKKYKEKKKKYKSLLKQIKSYLNS